MVRIACTMMQKDEDALLEPWFRFHGKLVGYENLFVFDNGSSSAHCLKVLRRYEDQGANIDRTYSTVSDYAAKGEIIAAIIRRLQSDRTYDFVFPLDCDEFVVLRDGDTATISRDRIFSHAETLVPLGGLHRVGKQFFNIINRPGEFGIADYTKTAIVLDGTFEHSDHGHHHCTTSAGSNYGHCDFAYVHYHYKPLAMLKAHARSKLAPFVNVDDLAAVAVFDGPGHHLRSYLQMTDAEFSTWHQGSNFYEFVEFNALLRSLGTPIGF